MIHIGLIGAGNMARVLLKEMCALNTSVFHVAGVYDPDPRSLDALDAQLSYAVTRYASDKQLIQAPNIQWVFIASWNKDHAKQAIRAFKAGKHVFCQKPIATSRKDALAMLRAWKKSTSLFSIGFSLRYTQHYRSIKKIIENRQLGDIISFEFNETLDFNHGGYIMGDWRRLTQNAGTHLLEKCCHDIDIANWLIGSPVHQVASFGGLRFFTPEHAHHAQRIGNSPTGKPAYQTWGGLVALNPFTSDKDILDHQVAILQYHNGITATFHTNLNAGLPERRLYILGSEGALRADLVTGKIEVKRIGFNQTTETLDTTHAGSHSGGDMTLAQELIDVMQGNTVPSVSLEEGLYAALVCFAIDEAQQKRKVVTLKPHERSNRTHT